MINLTDILESEDAGLSEDLWFNVAGPSVVVDVTEVSSLELNEDDDSEVGGEVTTEMLESSSISDIITVGVSS